VQTPSASSAIATLARHQQVIRELAWAMPSITIVARGEMKDVASRTGSYGANGV
jgi:hypothetical protein